MVDEELDRKIGNDQLNHKDFFKHLLPYAALKGQLKVINSSQVS